MLSTHRELHTTAISTMIDEKTTSLSARAEAFLFTEGGSLTRKKLMSLLQCKEPELDAALAELKKRLEGGGTTLLGTDTEVSLVVAKESSEAVREALKRELSRDIGDAGLEVLAIVLYCGPSTRARIDYIRGVNTSSTLRNLLARGLLEREGNPDDAREYLYKPTVELLAHLGARDVKELPEYDTMSNELKNFEQHGGGNTESTDD